MELLNLEKILRNKPLHKEIELHNCLPLPPECKKGWLRVPKGEKASYRCPFDKDMRAHIRIYGDHCTIEKEFGGTDSIRSALRHFFCDFPKKKYCDL